MRRALSLMLLVVSFFHASVAAAAGFEGLFAPVAAAPAPEGGWYLLHKPPVAPGRAVTVYAADGTPRGSFPVVGGAAAIAYSGGLLYAATGTALLSYKPESGAEAGRLDLSGVTGGRPLTALAAWSDGLAIAAGDELFTLRPGNKPVKLAKLPGTAAALAYSVFLKEIYAAVANDSHLYVINARGEVRSRATLPLSPVAGLAADAEARVFCALRDGTIVRVDTLGLVRPIAEKLPPLVALALSADRKSLLAVSAEDGVAVLVPVPMRKGYPVGF